MQDRPTSDRLPEHGQTALRDLHVLRVVATADPDRADDSVIDLDREAAAEDHQTVNTADGALGERRIVLDEVVPGVGPIPKPTAVNALS